MWIDRIAVIIASIIVFCFFATFNISGTVNAVEGIYTLPCLVIDEGDGYVTIDTGKDVFEFEGDGFKIGQIVKVTFNDNNTVDVDDDIIIDVR